MEETYSKLNSTQKIVVNFFFNNWLQSVRWYWLHSLVHLLQQLGTECTRWYWLHSLVHLLQQLGTECTRWYWVHSPVHFFNNWLQSVPTGTGYTALYTCFNHWLQSVPAGTSYTALCTCFNLPVTKYTNRVLATQPASFFCFCWLQRITGYSKVPDMESWYRTELPKVNLVTENS